MANHKERRPTQLAASSSEVNAANADAADADAADADAARADAVRELFAQVLPVGLPGTPCGDFLSWGLGEGGGAPMPQIRP